MSTASRHIRLPSPAPLTIGQTAAITVTFNPDMMVLEKQLRALADVGMVIVVDNASEPTRSDEIAALAASLPSICFLRSDRNAGLAAAVNRGFDEMRHSGIDLRAVLLLDQDSLFSMGTATRLLDALNAVQAEAGTLCCVGPVLQDPDSGMSHGFHYVASGWRWSRARPPAHAAPFPVRTLNGSGTMMPLALVDAIGGLEDSFFIDHIDTEWSFRVASKGGGLYGIPSISFEHRMGEAGRRIWLLGWRLWPERSPLRHYYLFRNTVRLLRRAYVPAVWKAWALMKLVMDMAVTTAIDERRAAQWSQMIRGIREGVQS